MALTISKAKLKTDFEYVPLAEKGAEKPFTVMFTAISLEALAGIQDDAIKVSQDGGYSVSINSLNYSVLRQALTGWKNVETDDGPIRFKKDNKGTTESTLALIPGDMRSELATVIVEVSKDLPNAETYLSELTLLADDDDDEGIEEEEEEVAKPKTTRARKK